MKIDVLPNSDVVAQEAAKFIAAEARAAVLAARAVQLCGEWRINRRLRPCQRRLDSLQWA
jgi:hypothetical protein